MKLLFVAAVLILSAPLTALSAPANFSEAKLLLRQVEGNGRTFYCDCPFRYTRGSSGTVDWKTCGYSVVKDSRRASRIEVDHVFAIYRASGQLACWRKGGRALCQKTSPEFNKMEADMHNLVISIGEINAAKSAYALGELGVKPTQFGSCDAVADSRRRLFQPRREIRGAAARSVLYMADRYNVKLSEKEEKLMLAWHRQFPVTKQERARHDHIAMLMGHSNVFVTKAP